MADERVIVKLHKQFRTNNKGEVCGFDKPTAEWLLAQKDAQGKPVAELVKPEQPAKK